MQRNKIHLIDKWKSGETVVFSCKNAPNDFSIYDGVGIWDISLSDIETLNSLLRQNGYSRIVKIK